MESSQPKSPVAGSRAHWPVRKGPIQELEGDEPDLSATTTFEERWAIMWQLAKDAWAFRGEPVGEPPFSRHPVKVLRRSELD
jgi:hypothetical protein